MHIRVNRQNFLSAIRTVEKSVKENKIKPILSCIYAKVKGNKIYFTGTNLDTTIKTSIDVNEVIREGEIAFSYSIIDEYLKEIKDEFVVLRVENGNILFIETEDSTTEYDVHSAEDYPNTFENVNLNDSNFKFEMPSQELVNIFEKVLFSADTPDNIAMNCIRIESILKHLHFVSTNTYRLTFLKKNINKDILDFSVSVPADTISSIIKIIKGLDNEVIKIEFKDNSSISFKKVGNDFIKVEEKNNETPSTPSENPNNNEQKEFSLKAINELSFENKYSFEPKDKIGKIKQIFLNNKEYRKSILQIFRISAPLFTIILSLIGLYLENIAYYILLINILSAVHVLYVNLSNNKVIL